VTRAADLGREAENLTAQYLIANGFPHMERRRLQGAKDKGDLAGSPGLMWEVKYLGRKSRPRMAGWMHEVDEQTVNANADYGILVVKPPGFGPKQSGKFWAIMRWESFGKLFNDAFSATPSAYALLIYDHSNAKLTTLGARLVELDRIPGHQWLVSIPPRVPETRGLAVLTLERMVPILHAAGYGGNGVFAGTTSGRVGGS
jgi:hypothetical protein